MLKQQIHFDEHVFSIQIQLPPQFAANIDKLKSSKLENIINLKNDNYQSTDQKTQLNYFVTFSNEYISFNFAKSELVNYDIDILMKSLKDKLYYQHISVDRLFSSIKQLEKVEYSYIREIEYSPTYLSIEIRYGNMMDVRYQISAFTFNPLFEQPSNINPTKVFITNQTLNDSNSRMQSIFKNHPMNLGLANTFSIDQFVEYLHKTYIPMQILTHRLTDLSFIQSISNYFLTLHPTKSFAILIIAPNQDKVQFWFGSEPLIISINSKFENNELCLELDSGAVYYTLQGLQKNNDFQQFQQYIKRVITKWKFEKLNEVDEFFNKFLLYLFSYFLLSSNKERFYNLLFKVSFERIERTLRSLIQKAAFLSLNYFGRIQERGDYINSLKKYYHYFIERNIKLYEIILIEQHGTIVGEIVQCFLEKQERRYAELIKQQFKEEDFKYFVDKNLIIGYHQTQYQIKVSKNKYVFNTIEKLIQKSQEDQNTQTWTYDQFPESELKIIKDEI